MKTNIVFLVLAVAMFTGFDRPTLAQDLPAVAKSDICIYAAQPNFNDWPNPFIGRWQCDQQLSHFEDDEQAMRELIRIYLAEAEAIFSRQTDDPDDINLDKRRAVGITMTSAIWASDKLEDSELAVRICQDYLLPNQDAANPERWDCLSQEEVLFTVISVWEKAGETGKVIDLYKSWIPRDTNANNADANRIRLASIFADQERYEEAISSLSQIDANGGCAAGRLLIPDLEKKLAEQRAERDAAENSTGR